MKMALVVTMEGSVPDPVGTVSLYALSAYRHCQLQAMLAYMHCELQALSAFRHYQPIGTASLQALSAYRQCQPTCTVSL